MPEGDEIEALIHPGDDGKFWAEVVGLPGCYAQGDIYSKILTALRDAHELCSAAGTPTNAIPHTTAIVIDEGSTVSDLTGQLIAAGWSATGASSELHALYSHPSSGVNLCLPSDPAQMLNSGFRKAVTDFLGA